MREKIKDKGRIEHMLEMARSLAESQRRHSFEEVVNDKILFYGLTKMVEIIGEAAYKLSRDFIGAHPELPWKEMIGMRHVLVHGYYQITPEDLWDVIQNDIPSLIPTLEKFLSELKSE